MTLPFGTLVRSRRNLQTGIIAGYGVLQWKGGRDDLGEITSDPEMVPVYLVRIGVASSSLGPVCAVFRADQVEVYDPT